MHEARRADIIIDLKRHKMGTSTMRAHPNKDGNHIYVYNITYAPTLRFVYTKTENHVFKGFLKYLQQYTIIL